MAPRYYELITILIYVVYLDAWCSKRDCEVTQWGPWGACTQTCGNSGTSERKRYIISDHSCGGKKCGRLFKTRKCNRVCCPIACTYTWGAWGVCTGCGENGQQISKPVVTEQAQCGGPCDLPASRKRSCDTKK